MRHRTLTLLAVPLLAAGCTRGFWRQQADRETYPVIAERVVSPAYAVGRTRVEPAPTSRLADNTDPDRPPKPPDDPAAARFMAHPYRFKGAHGWEKDGVTPSVEPAGWQEALGAGPDGVLKLTPESATEIALANSREYQTQVEQVYLIALALTLNRFQFDTQYFARSSTLYNRVGASSVPFETNTLTQFTDVGFARNLAAGGQLLVDFANTFVWEFTGKQHTATGTFTATLIQPLLRGFSKKVRLENLTQAERDTLYAVRGFARFRKQFWAGVNVEDGGYLQLLRAVQAVRNARANVKAQEENYALYRRLFQGGRTQVVNVDQVYQGLLSARSGLIAAEVGLQNQLDQFKLRLGLPPRLPVELDDSKLNQFVLVEPATETLRDELDRFERDRKAELDSPPTLDTLRRSLDTLDDFVARSAKAIDATEVDLKRWAADLERPAKTDEEKEQRERSKAAYEAQNETPAELREALAKVREALPGVRAVLTEDARVRGWEAVVAAARELAFVLDAAIVTQSQARIDTLRLPEIDIPEADALRFAHDNRLDLQNALGQVTDAWRKVTVAANALRSDFTVRLDANLISDPDRKNPFDLSNDVSRYAVGVQFDGPLNRQAERNNYRASLINYQRARRFYMGVSDSVEFDIRTGLRALRLQRVNFEIARQQLLVASRQLAIERRNLTAPVAANAQRRDDDAATLRILNAQQQLLNARNALADNFFGYEQQRVRLLINLEALLLDDRGFPCDQPAFPVSAGAAAADAPPP